MKWWMAHLRFIRLTRDVINVSQRLCQMSRPCAAKSWQKAILVRLAMPSIYVSLDDKDGPWVLLDHLSDEPCFHILRLEKRHRLL